MTDNNHPMLPTQEQLTEWDSERFDEGENFDVMMIKAFQAGADQELEACCEWLKKGWIPAGISSDLRAARRPEPPSLKEQALQALENADGADHPVVATVLTADQHALIRKALEKLDD